MLTLVVVVIVFGVHSAVDWTWFVPANAGVAMLCAGWVVGRGPLRARLEHPDGAGPAAAPPGRTPAGSQRFANSVPPLHGLAAALVLVLALAAAWTAFQPVRAVHAGDAAFDRLDARPAGRRRRRSPQIATERNPLSVDPLFELAAIEQARGRNTEAARPRSSRPSDLEPASAEAWRRLGRLRLDALNDPQGALSAFQAAYYLDPQAPAVHLGHHRGQPRRALPARSPRREADAQRAAPRPTAARARRRTPPDRASARATRACRSAGAGRCGSKCCVEAQQADQRGLDAAVERHGDEQAPAGAQHAPRLEQQVLGVGDVLEHLRAPHQVDARVLERQRAVRLDQRAGRRPARCGARARAPPRRSRRRPGRRRRRAARRRSARRRSRGRARARRAAPRRAAAPAGAPTPTARDPAARPPRRTRSGRAPAPRVRFGRDAAATDPARDAAGLAWRAAPSLVDPMLDPAGARPPVQDTPNQVPNPLVDAARAGRDRRPGPRRASSSPTCTRTTSTRTAIELLPEGRAAVLRARRRGRAARPRLRRRAPGRRRGRLGRRPDRPHRRRARPARPVAGVRARGRRRAHALRRRRHDLVRRGARGARRAPARRRRRQRQRRALPRAATRS